MDEIARDVGIGLDRDCRRTRRSWRRSAPVPLWPIRRRRCSGRRYRATGWIAADGCCVAARHVRGVQTVNGQILGAQRFAIDWERLNEKNRIFVGDPEDVESYFAYRQPVLAVADARVARVLDGLEEQVPGALPDVIALEEADGNHVVLDLGDGRFVLYAHMIPGSITVDEGDQVGRALLA